MKCPNCKIDLLFNAASQIFYCSSCDNCQIQLDRHHDNECIYYWFLIGKYALMGYNFNPDLLGLEGNTSIWDKHSCILKVDWISIRTDNLSEDIPKLYNRLMKLKVFT